jgi:hypothetical protein
MRESRPARDIQGVRLEATIRKALADAWARGATKQEADRTAVQMAREKFPDKPQHEISELIQRMRGELA